MASIAIVAARVGNAEILSAAASGCHHFEFAECAVPS